MRIALGCVVLVGCSAAPQAPAPAPVAASPAASPCVAEVVRAEDASRALSAQGRLDAALMALESAPACAEHGVTDAAAELSRVLAAGPAGGDAVREGWAAWLAGDRVSAERTFARVLRAHVASGTLPRPFVAKRAARTTRVAGTTFASAVTDVIGGAHGALLFDVERAPGRTTAAPLRFVPGAVAEGPEGLVLLGAPSLHLASATGAPTRLPRGGLPANLPPAPADAEDHGAVLGGGRVAVLGARGRFVAVDLPSGVLRTGPAPTVGVPAGDAGALVREGAMLVLCSSVSHAAFAWDPVAAARWGWTMTVVDLQAGELRATVDTEESGGRVALLAGDFLVAGGELHDLSRARAVDRGAEARIDPGLLPADVETKAIPGGASFALSRAPGRTLRATTRDYALADGAAPPSWLYCLVGEWILPVETCSHRLTEMPNPR